MSDTKADELFCAIRLFIAAEIKRALEGADFDGRLKAFAPAFKTEILQSLPMPVNGKDADPAVIRAEVERVVAELPKAEKGDPGKDADSEAIAADVLDKVTKSLPTVKDGEPGKSVTVDDVRPILEGEIAKAVLDIDRRAVDTVDRAISKIPAPVNGKDGADGINGKDGEPGKDGRDGVSLESFDFKSIDGGRILRFEGKGGDVLVAREVTTDVLLDRGVFESGKSYSSGDSISYGGSLFVATRKTLATERPADGSGAFRLAVKRGRDASQAA